MSKGNIKIPNPSGKQGFEITKKSFTKYFTVQVSRFLFFARFVHEKYFDHARNRARLHDKIFFVISNPEVNFG